jgi:TetR/AcrR family transcriptional regulator, ethionamide resistance regulator
MRRKSVKRRRRRPEEAEAEILAAAERFLRRRPFRDLQVANLMDETGLRRSSFYHYFRDRHDVVVRLVEKLSSELTPMNEMWFQDEQDPAGSLRVGSRGVGEFWAKHGPVLRAIAEAAIHDRKVEKAHRALVDRIAQGTADRIRVDVTHGRTAPLDPDETARALIAMSERFLNERLGRPGRRDWRPVVETLSRIWLRTLYGVAE